MSRRRDRRSAEADAYRPLYKTARWTKARAAQLSREPNCEACLERGHEVAATVVNHKTPHKGDLELFWNPNNHQSVCKPHHDGPIQREERTGFSNAVDEAGWPTDPRHRANKPR